MLRKATSCICLLCSENACLCWTTRRYRGLNCDVAFYCFNYLFFCLSDTPATEWCLQHLPFCENIKSPKRFMISEKRGTYTFNNIVCVITSDFFPCENVLAYTCNYRDHCSV